MALKKSKRSALLLSVIAGPWVWALTYDKDKLKFWIGSVVQLMLVAVSLIVLHNIGGSHSYTKTFDYIGIFALWFFVIAPIIFISLRVWALIDTATKSESRYANHHAQPPSKTTAIILSIFLGYLTWLYTVERDDKKF